MSASTRESESQADQIPMTEEQQSAETEGHTELKTEEQQKPFPVYNRKTGERFDALAYYCRGKNKFRTYCAGWYTTEAVNESHFRELHSHHLPRQNCDAFVCPWKCGVNSTSDFVEFLSHLEEEHGGRFEKTEKYKGDRWVPLGEEDPAPEGLEGNDEYE